MPCFVGMGIGAYNHHELLPCLKDSHKLASQKAAIAKEKAAPYVKEMSAKATPYVKELSVKAQDKAAQAMSAAGPMAKDGFAKAKDKATPYLKLAQEKMNTAKN